MRVRQTTNEFPSTPVIRLLAIFLLPVVLTSCAGDKVETGAKAAFTTDAIVSVAHGAFIAADNREVAPGPALIREMQRTYIARLLSQAESGLHETGLDEHQIARTRALIDRADEDEILANALYIDWLIDKVQPEERAHLTSINNAMRWRYYLETLGEERPTKGTWSKGIDPAAAKELVAEGIPAIIPLGTQNGGEAYIQECRDAGVPVPDAMFSSEWQLQGVFDKEFISEPSQAELWLHTSQSPAGVCLALPRYAPKSGGGFSDEAGVLGIICLGTQSNKSCFFDNPSGVEFTRGVEVGIDQFVGGVDLEVNGQGVCSDCHAGENPFVVHPEKEPFASLPSMQPGGWPEPLVHPSWPQNPGPINLLDAVPSTGRCDSCHQNGSAGRFPDVSTELRGYCRTILANAIGQAIGSGPTPDPSKRTMPPFGMDKSQFVAHINALANACNSPPTGGGVDVPTDVEENPGVVSAPIVIDPLYQCATRVAVRGGILDAKMELFLNGASVATRVVRSPSQEVFTVPSLVAGDQVTAIQVLGGASSPLSAPVTVRDHTVDFPGGLPAPEIDPTLIHECGDIIAVRHVPGARLTVFSNGGSPRTGYTSSGWTAIRPGKRPFDVGDAFTAEIELCGDVSPLSGKELAVPAPPTLPAPTLNPGTSYVGQELVTVENIVYGARVNLSEASVGPIGDFTWPVSRYSDYDIASRMGSPLAPGDQLIVSQDLCFEGPAAELPPVAGCDELPAPRIRHPEVGNRHVVVTESVPGARVRVYDDSGDELGDGSGTVITLKRALIGTDILTVVQQVGGCTSSKAYRVSVRFAD